jgi:hypothetical protein
MNQQATEAVNRRPEFVTLVAVYQFVTAGILLLLSCLILAVLLPFLLLLAPAGQEVFITFLMMSIVLAFVLGFGFASLIVGWGLLRMREWARLGALVLALFALIGFPIWTIAGVLILLYLTSEEARSAFERSRSGKSAVSTEDQMATRAAYKTEPSPPPPTASIEQTRPIRATSGPSFTSEGPATPESFPGEESTTKIVPVSSTPADTSEQPTVEMQTDTIESEIESPPPSRPRRKWIVPAEEAGMDRRILEPLDSDQSANIEDDEDEEKSR